MTATDASGSAAGCGMPFKDGFRIVSPYGWRTDPITGEAHVWHNGVDLVHLGTDKDVRAVCGGSVIRSRMAEDDGLGDRTWEWGNYVAVLGDDGAVLYYCHLERRLARVGDRVEAGQVLGVEGSTGRSTGVHLHLEARTDGISFDPTAYLGVPNEAGYVRLPAGNLPAGKEKETGAGSGSGEPWEKEASPWAREAVGRLIRAGILRGRGGGTYALGEYVTREEVCVLIDRAMGEEARTGL